MPDLRSPRAWLAIVWSLFQLYTAKQGMFDLMIQLPVHVAFATALGFLTPESSAPRTARRRRLDGLGALTYLGVEDVSDRRIHRHGSDVRRDARVADNDR